MKKLLILLLIPFLSFQSFSQTDEVDRLKKIWIDEMIEFGDISIKNIDWNAVFVPYYLERRINKNTNKYPYKTIELDVERFLTAIGIQTGTYYRKKTAKDTNNREMTLSTNRIARGRYWVDMEGLFNGIYPAGFVYNITDSKNNFITVGNIKIDTRTETYKSWKKARNKYIKKRKIDKRRVKSYSQVVWEEILKRYKNTKQIKRTLTLGLLSVGEFVSVDEFAEKIKAKYPSYAQWDNLTLVKQIIAKYPEYKNQVDLSTSDSSVAIDEEVDIIKIKEDAKKKLLELKEFLDLGIITKEEFDNKAAPLKKILLDN